MDAKIFRIESKIKNNRLYQLRVSKGLTQMDVAKALKMSHGTYLKYEGLKISPFERYGKGLKDSAIKIAKFFKVAPEVLFPDVLERVEQTSVVKYLDDKDLVALSNVEEKFLIEGNTPEAMMDKVSYYEGIDKALGTLTPREEKVLQMRFGLEGYEPHTFKEIASKFGRSADRIIQIEKKALRKLRHPKNRRLLKNYEKEDVNEFK